MSRYEVCGVQREIVFADLLECLLLVLGFGGLRDGGWWSSHIPSPGVANVDARGRSGPVDGSSHGRGQFGLELTRCWDVRLE